MDEADWWWTSGGGVPLGRVGVGPAVGFGVRRMGERAAVGGQSVGFGRVGMLRGR